ncbi:MAG: NMD3-related protein [Candidatus Jordarchaeaceae archaeon]
MAKRFCALCGKTDTPLIENLCYTCYFRKNPPFSINYELKIRICSNCFSYKLAKKWVQTESSSLADIIEKAISQVVPYLIKNPEVEIVNVKPQIPKEMELTGRVEVPVLITAKKNDIIINETLSVPINVESMLCGVCTRKKSGAFEAIIQFRSLKGQISEEEKQQVYEILNRTFSLERYKGAYISDVKEKREGFDIYVSSIGLAKSIATSAKEIMGASIHESFKISGMKDGKKLGKFSLSVRLPSFSVGEVVQLPDKIIIFEKIEKGNIIGKNPETGERSVIQYKELWESEIQSWKPEIKEYQIISMTENSLQLMDLKTYDIIEIKKPLHTNVNQGETVKVIKIDKKMMILTPEN